MLFAILSLAGLAASMPLTARQDTFQPTSSGQAFQLITNITDPVKLQQEPFASLQGQALASIRTGPGSNIPALLSPGNDAGGSVFWQNDTTHGRDEEGVLRARHSILTDNMFEADALAIVQDSEREHELRVYEERGTLGSEGFSVDTWQVARMQYPTMRETEMQLLVCDRKFSSYGHPQFQLAIAHATIYQGGVEQYIDEDCVAVNLLVQCADLPPLSENATYTREYLMEVPCYDNVASIDWSQ